MWERIKRAFREETFVMEFKNSLTKELCQDIIYRFEKDTRKVQGMIGVGEVDLEVKKSKDLFITGIEGWKDVDAVLFEQIHKACHAYAEKYEILKYFELYDKGYQIQRTEPGEGYIWHSDADYNALDRQYVFIWYLNDVPKGGETELFTWKGRKIKPEAGKLVLFPASWTHTHRGNPPIGGNKYIITGWMCCTDNTTKKLGEPVGKT